MNSLHANICVLRIGAVQSNDGVDWTEQIKDEYSQNTTDSIES